MDLTVTYIVKESGVRVNKTFDSDFKCRAFNPRFWRQSDI